MIIVMIIIMIMMIIIIILYMLTYGRFKTCDQPIYKCKIGPTLISFPDFEK